MKKDPNKLIYRTKLVCPNSECPGTTTIGKRISNFKVTNEKKLDGSLLVVEVCEKCTSSMTHKRIEDRWYSTYTVNGVTKKGRNA